MNVTIDIFNEDDDKVVDHLGNLVDTTNRILDMDMSQLMAFTDVAFGTQSSIVSGVFNDVDVQAVRMANNRKSADTKISPCFKDFSRLPALLTHSETLEDFL